MDSFIVTVAQANLDRAEDDRVQAATDVHTALVGLFRALGGGWRTTEARPGD